jgi:hypothetical protein
MSESDFMHMTRNGALCNEAGEIGAREFETILRGEITTYIQVRAYRSSRNIRYVTIMRGEMITYRDRGSSRRRPCGPRHDAHL